MVKKSTHILQFLPKQINDSMNIFYPSLFVHSAFTIAKVCLLSSQEIGNIDFQKGECAQLFFHDNTFFM